MLDNIGKLLADKELEDLLKKKKRQIANYYLTIYKAELEKRIAAANYEKYKRAMADMRKKLMEKKPAVPKQFAEMASWVRHAEAAKKKMYEYFSLDKLPDAEKLREDLKAADMTEEEFKLAAFAATGDNLEDMAGFLSYTTRSSGIINKLKGPDQNEESSEISKEADLKDKSKEIKNSNSLKELTEEEKNAARLQAEKDRQDEEKYSDVDKFNSIRDEGILKAREAFYEYTKGNPKNLGKIIGNAIKKSCDKFATERDMDTAMQWSMYTEEMLKLADKHPQLLKEAGLTEEQLNVARNVADMGKNIKEGLVAVERMAEAALDTKKPLTPEENELLTSKIVSMSATYSIRQDVIKDWDVLEKTEFRKLDPEEKISEKKDTEMKKTETKKAIEKEAPVLSGH